MSASAPLATQPTDPVRPQAIIIFVDIRGFSQWSKEIDAHENTLSLVDRFQKVLQKHFKDFYSKPLGDGAMLIKELKLQNQKDIQKEIDLFAQKAHLVEKEFEKITKEIAVMAGHSTDLLLGWGVTRGKVIKQNEDGHEDYLGHHVNKAARLCDLARPYGIVIDREDFTDRPTKYREAFYEQTKKLSKPYQEVSVWVSKEINQTFQVREFLRETPEVHIAGICIRDDENGVSLLLNKRSMQRELFPGKWEGCGGQLRFSESFHEGVRRHWRTEMGVEVEVLAYVNPEIYTVERAGKHTIPGMRFLCKHISGLPKSPNHDEFAWVPYNKFLERATEEFPVMFQQTGERLIERYLAAKKTPAKKQEAD